MNFSSYRAALREEIRRAYPQLDALVVLTRADLEEYRREIPSLRRLVQIPNAVPPVDGAGTSDLAAPVLLAAGRLTPQKGFDRLLRAWAHVAPERPEWRLRICGDGPQHKALRKLVGELGIADRVDLAGRSDDLGADMAAASLFVLSSRFEGLPMVLLEAMSRGLPVVGFDCPTGPREVISDGTDGILVRNGDEPGLARAIASVTADPDARRRLGAAAAAKASEFSLEAILPRWHELLRSLT
jgi:glycosyltransferase involved in cell wall biosynthesis